MAATSFHWVAQPHGWQNLGQSLRPGGWAAIWWMLFQDPTAPDEFDLASSEVVGGSPVLPENPEAVPFQIDAKARTTELARAGFVDVGVEFIRANYSMTSRQIRDLYASMAVVLRRRREEQVVVLDQIESLVAEHFGGTVERCFLTALYRGRWPPQDELPSTNAASCPAAGTDRAT